MSVFGESPDKMCNGNRNHIIDSQYVNYDKPLP